MLQQSRSLEESRMARDMSLFSWFGRRRRTEKEIIQQMRAVVESPVVECRKDLDLDDARERTERVAKRIAVLQTEVEVLRDLD